MSSPAVSAPLSEWLAYLETLHPTEIDLGLDRIRQVANALKLDYPYTVITVGGTNGKGSVCAMLEAICLAAGYRTGTYTSPHLVHYNERIRINGGLAGDEQIVAAFERIEAARGRVSLSYFEFSTLAALLLFQDSKLDVAVLEVGLGGRLDAVNIVDADCAIVTSIDIDHRDWLGDTREAIGLEKAHIFRPGRPAICADPVPPQSLIDHAGQIGADLWLFGHDFNYSGDRQQWAYGGRNQRRSSLAYPALRGANQLLNATAALAALEALRDRLVVPQQAVRLGLAHAALPGRFQVMPGQPLVILDVAHNPHAAAALGQNLAHMPGTGRTYAVVGMMRDKDAAGVLARLAPHVHVWLCAGLPVPRGLSAKELAQQLHTVTRSLRAGGPDDLPAASEGWLPDPHMAGQGSSATVGVGANGAAGPAAGALARPADASPAVRPMVRAAAIPHDVEILEFSDPVTAFEHAREIATLNDRILVFGSFATVGPVLDQLGRKAS